MSLRHRDMLRRALHTGPISKKCVPFGIGPRLQVGFKITSSWLEWVGPNFWCPFHYHIDCHVGQMEVWAESLYKVFWPNLQQSKLSY